MKSSILAMFVAGTAGLLSLFDAPAATLDNRYSFSSAGDAMDSVGGNDGVLLNGATVDPALGGLVLPGTGAGVDAANMGFTNLIDIGVTYGATGVSLETWYTDDGTGTWGKLFTFGTSTAGQEIGFTNMRGGTDLAPGLDRNGALALASYPFGSNTQPSLNEEHHLVVTIAADGTTNLWLDGTQEITAAATNPLSNVVNLTESIGATAWGDPGHLGSVTEFRIYEGELTPTEVAVNNAAGPDVLATDEDSDADGLPDVWEERWFGNGNLSQGADDDPDMDGLTNLEEFNYNPNLNPDDSDTDDDDLSDGDEVNTHMTNPLLADTDGDTLTDGDEVLVHMTNPLLRDTDMDLYPDDVEIANMTDPNDPNDPAPLSQAELAHRYSFTKGAELVDSVGGNTGVLVNTASVSGNQLQLDGAGTGAGASSMQFTNLVDIGGNFGATGVSFETWYTDTGTGIWGKLFTFGTSAAGQEVAWTNMRGGGDIAPGLDRNGAHGITTHPFGSSERFSLDEEHYLALSIAPDGTTNLWIDGTLEISELATNPITNIVSNVESIGSTAWGDPGHLGSVNEFRIWHGELTAEDVATNLLVGPDSLAGLAPFEITDITYNDATGTVSITWNSIAGKVYALDVAVNFTGDPSDWVEDNDGIPSTSESTTYEYTPPNNAVRQLFRIRDASP